MAYVPPDPSQPLPEEPDTQNLEDEYANVRDATFPHTTQKQSGKNA